MSHYVMALRGKLIIICHYNTVAKSMKRTSDTVISHELSVQVPDDLYAAAILRSRLCYN